ncbi:hypothetical protein [Pontibacter sp. SGAir0037]|uniref:hypothetical protein n=1 Tax=Pontibacter sp. SGAir0037 TaxID=2571030 RepID=UPI0010CD1C77|nr:hypothetical protein [Pontibacter sp. SGAir0037]QCR24326.1 hypothetical protein C1N53_19490 [Pontibacter sp. SGAir0037]
MKKSIFLLAAASLFTFASCESGNETRTEDTSERIEEDAEEAGDKFEERTDEAGDKIEDAGDDIEDKVD